MKSGQSCLELCFPIACAITGIVLLTSCRSTGTDNPIGDLESWQPVFEAIGQAIEKKVKTDPPPMPPEPTPAPAPPAGGFDTGRGGRYDLPPPASGVSGTFLWKPHSESTGRVFILTTGKRWLDTRSVEIWHMPAPGQFAKIEDVRWHRNNEPGVNGWRLHWSAARKAVDYPAPVWVREETFGGAVYEYFIPTPTQRVEDGSGGKKVK